MLRLVVSVRPFNFALSSEMADLARLKLKLRVIDQGQGRLLVTAVIKCFHCCVISGELAWRGVRRGVSAFMDGC